MCVRFLFEFGDAYNGFLLAYGWTQAHGFFVIMGGFYLFDGKTLQHPLTRNQVKDLVQKGLLIPPSEDEIKDKSKGDALSKAIVLVQVAWFVVQCIARRIQHLPITELEIMTLAYTAVNAAIYGFWWYKPLSVRCPVRVVAGSQLSEAKVDLISKGPWLDAISYVFKLVDGTQDSMTNVSDEKQVPIFYAAKPDKAQRDLAAAISVIVAMIFGGIHCFAWSLQFPSHAEQLLWRVSSIAILGYPGILGLTFLFESLWVKYYKHPITDITSRRYLIVLFVLGIPVYVAGRVILVVLAFATLRSLPQGAYGTPQWTIFIPHI